MPVGRRNRRAFIAALGGVAAWPMVARGQSERMRRIGVLMGVDDADFRASNAVFVEALQQLGWTDHPTFADTRPIWLRPRRRSWLPLALRP
jgi:hypothetical protein